MAENVWRNMPRHEREKSPLGIYHVMLRGINKQDIFFDEDDFIRMMTILQEIPFKKEKLTGKVVSSGQCTIYAYCILHNHLHLLIKEGDLTLPEIMKIIADRYAMYYNRKYERIGHLFQGRFPSEAIKDEVYFHTVIRYIFQNPVKALESPTPAEYPYSGWNEYISHKSNIIKVLKPSAIQAVLRKYPITELEEWVNSSSQDHCLDMDAFNNVKSDKEAWEILSELCALSNPEDFRMLDAQTQIYYLLEAIEHGVNLRQASRLGTITRYQITKAFNKKFGETSTAVSVPVAENLEKADENCLEVHMEGGIEQIQQRVRQIDGQGKQMYFRLHQIVEYLYANGESKCTEISISLKMSNESIRKALVLLANENIIDIVGNGRLRAYKLK